MSEYTEQLEREYQNEVVKLFVEQLEYDYLGNLQYARGVNTNSSGLKNGPIIDSELRSYLNSAGYTPMQVEEAVRQLKSKARLTDKRFVCLCDTNNSIYEMLVQGISAKPTPERNEEDVMFFDFKHPYRNRFAIAEEVSYIDPLTTSHCRPDIVVYVNGIALCIIELKRAFVSIDEAIRQNLSNERDLIPSFFTTTQFTVAAHRAEHKEGLDKVKDEHYGFKYATVGTPLEFWCPWKKDTNQTGIVLSDTESYLDFFNKETFMFLVRYGVLSDGGIKKVMRPHQYHALRAAEPRLYDQASGVIWHSQGSGKSLTMVWIASFIRDNFKDPRVIVITDRTELDVQLSSDFSDAGNNLHRATSQEDLLKTLQSGKEWLIMTLIHKFGNRRSGGETTDKRSTKIPLDSYLRELKATIARQFPEGFKAKGKNIFIFIDECHRTQGGRLHDAMREIMGQNVMLIGFTGTPLLKDDKKKGYNAFRNVSEIKFGEIIHKYLHKQAVEDKVILDLQYEAREIDQYIASESRLDSKLEEIVTGLSDDRKELVKDRWATLKKVYSSNDRIEQIGYSILDDMAHDSILRQDWANAMLVAGDIYSAYRYYKFFQHECPDTRLRDRVAVVTSYEPNENDIRRDVTDPTKMTEEKFKYDTAKLSFADATQGGSDAKPIITAAGYEAWAKNLFIHKPGRMKLLIVVDKLLTGFDAPSATYLYIDKEMHDHTLFQAICRVNRLGTDVKDEEGNVVSKNHKEYGIIVDFKHLFGKIKDSVTKFNDESGGFGGMDSADIEGLLEDNIAKNKKRLITANEAFQALKSHWQSLNLTNNDLLAEYYMSDFDNDPAESRRTVMYHITSNLTSSYDNLADLMGRAGFSTEESNYYECQAREGAHINLYIKQRSGDAFDPRNYDPDMRVLLDRFIKAEDAEVIVPATADFSFLDLLDDDSDSGKAADNATKESGGNEKSAADIIEAKTRAVINNSRDRDPVAYAKFSERLQQLLDLLHHNTVYFREYMVRMIDILREAKIGGAHFPEGIDTPLKKALWNNRESLGFNDDNAAEMTLEVSDAVESKARPSYKEPGHAHYKMFLKELKKALPDASPDQIEAIHQIVIRN